MTAGTLNNIHAVVAPAARTPSSAPMERLSCTLGDPLALVDLLDVLGLTVPPSLSAAASTGKKLEDLRVSSHRYPVREVDAALSETKLSMQDRLRVKAALARAGLIN